MKLLYKKIYSMLYNFKFLKIKFDNLIKQFQFYFIKEYIHALNIKNIKKIFKIFIKNVIIKI